MTDNLQELIQRWRSAANDCDVDGLKTSIAGAISEQDRAELLNRCANELEKALGEPREKSLLAEARESFDLAEPSERDKKWAREEILIASSRQAKEAILRKGSLTTLARWLRGQGLQVQTGLDTKGIFLRVGGWGALGM